MDIDKPSEKVTEEVCKKLTSQTSEAKPWHTCGGGSCGNVAGKNLAGMIDHTILKADATVDQVKKLCQEAIEHKFVSVCVNPSHVALSVQLLNNSGVKVCTVIGFPLGATTTGTKVFEAREAIENGATEVDMVINVGAVKSGDYDLVRNDIESVVLASKGRASVKAIIETSLLTDDEKIIVCTIAKTAGVDFVKTSTGFSTGGATVEDIVLMRRVVGQDIGIKASGGIKDLETATAMIQAGATRLGTSNGVAIITSDKISIQRHY